ncbi:hypothetical protein Pla163_37820 [Planctomycetes bacterium Pla163]|uniref:RiboL-PSP-HEPN domain-containing protein n=1 Tax=Rohdeia mirabilis TaxID=2528008 RepID=A0A518D586_9BACT|nr:hypothetical protein Pla163_37820 [Planctomycetes bacterium Pla163]
MAGRPPKVAHVNKAFRAEIASARGLVDAMSALPAKIHPSIQVGVHPKHLRQVVALAFMGVVSAWEEFLERTLVRYLAGASADSGYSPALKHGSANSLAHAYEVLSLNVDYNPQRDYLKASDARWVWRTADFFFSSHPYGALNNKADLLKNASRIRNRIAHDSEKCKSDFRVAALWFLQPANGQLTQGYGPGSLLLDTAQRNFGNQINQAGISHFEAYMRAFESLAGSVVP